MAIFALHFSGFSSIFGSINLMVTIMNMRANGMDYSKLNLFTWSILITAVLILISILVLAAKLIIIKLAALYFAICWNIHLFVNGQSAGNLYNIYNIRYLRDYTRKLIIYFLINPLNLLLNKYNNYINNLLIKELNNLDNNLYSNNQLGYYLAGLIEGDGSINILTTLKSKLGKNKYLSIQITFIKKDFLLAMMISKNLNCGSISKKKNANAYDLVINDYLGLLKLIKLINGKFRTLKIDRLNLLIDWYNYNGHYLLENKLEKYLIDNSLLDSNSWLSGLIDADGNFYIRHGYSNKSLVTKTIFRISQSKLDKWGNDKLSYMQNIANLFFTKCKLIDRTSTNKGYHYIIITNSFKSNMAVIDYLTKYLLFSSKYLDYCNYKEIVKLFENRLNHTLDNIELIVKNKNSMNNNRIVFNWNHLNNFYTIN